MIKKSPCAVSVCNKQKTCKQMLQKVQGKRFDHIYSSMQMGQHRRMFFCQQSLVCSEERQIVHGQMNAIDNGQPPTRSAGTSLCYTSVPFHAHL